MFLLCLLCCIGSEQSRVVLLDGQAVMAATVSEEKSMVCCVLPTGDKLLMSKGMVDWEAMKRVNPAVFKAFFPEASLEPARPRDRAQKGIVITNDDLKTLPPRSYEEQPLISGDASNTSSGQSKSASKKGPIIDRIGVPGETIEVKRHMEPGRFVMFDFYADWCGPCRQLTPRLESLARKHPDKVALKKIDIVKWGTPVARQFGINSIPYVQLYDESGKKIRDGNGFEVLQHVERMSASW